MVPGMAMGKKAKKSMTLPDFLPPRMTNQEISTESKATTVAATTPMTNELISAVTVRLLVKKARWLFSESMSRPSMDGAISHGVRLVQPNMPSGKMVAKRK